VFGAVHGHGIYPHNWQIERMAPLLHAVGIEDNAMIGSEILE
jgi:hypothetical protein